MGIRTLAGALALGLLTALALPAAAQADHCRRPHYSRGYSYYKSYPRYYSHSYYAPAPYYYDDDYYGSYYVPVPRYYRPYYRSYSYRPGCYRPRLGAFFRW